MKKKKSLQLAIALTISTLVIPGYGEARGSIYAGENVGNNETVTASADAYPNLVGHAFGIYTNGGTETSQTIVGNNLTINTSGQAGDGIRSNPSGDTNWEQAKGIITIGAGLAITTSGVSADGINLNGSTIVNIGNDAVINTTYAGDLQYSDGSISDGAHAVRSNFHATINIKDGLTASTLGNSSYAVYAANGRARIQPTTGSKINIGNGAKLTTQGDDSHAVMMASKNGKIDIGSGAILNTYGDRAHGIAAYSDTSAKGTTAINGMVLMGDGATITSEGVSSYGVFANMTGAKISLGTGTTIITKGDGSHGVVAQKGVVELGDGLNVSVEGENAYGIYTNAATGSVILNGGATVNTNDNGSYALYADKGSITGEEDNAIFVINGDMLADNAGIIDLAMDNASSFTGSTSMTNDGIINLSLDKSSKWFVTGNSAVNKLNLVDGSLVDMTKDGTLDTEVNIGELTGSDGVFKFDTELNGELNGDKLYIDNATNDIQYVQVKDVSLVNGEVIGEKKLHLITDSSGNAVFKGQSLDNGGLWDVTPTIERGDALGLDANDWYLTKVEKGENGNTETINDGFASDYSLWRATNDTLRKRLGDIRGGEHGEEGVWARMYHGKLKSQSYTDRYHTYQLGYDKTRGERTNGIVIERSEGNLGYSAGAGETNFTALSLYSSWFGDKGHYSDVVVRGGRLAHKMHTYGEFAERSDYDTNAYNISFEYGREKQYDKGWFFTPQAQLTVGRLNGSDFTTERGTKVSVDGVTSAIGRLGFEMGRKLNADSSYYFKLGAFHEFDGKRDVSMLAANGDTLSKSYDYGDTWYEFGIGAQVKISRNTHFYGDIERSFGGDTKKEWQVNTGFRWEF